MKPLTCKACEHQFFLEEREVWNSQKQPCPECQETYCTRPQSERELTRLQDIYLEKGRDPEVLGTMYLILVPYATSLIRRKYSHIVPPSEHELKGVKAANYLVEDYCKKDTFIVKASFGGLLLFKIKQAVFGNDEYDENAKAKKWDYSVVSMDKENHDGQTMQIASSQSSNRESLSFQEKEEVRNYLLGLIWSVEKHCLNEEVDYRRLMALMVFMERGEAAFDRLISRYGRVGKWEAEKTLALLQKELSNI